MNKLIIIFLLLVSLSFPREFNKRIKYALSNKATYILVIENSIDRFEETMIKLIALNYIPQGGVKVTLFRGYGGAEYKFYQAVILKTKEK